MNWFTEKKQFLKRIKTLEDKLKKRECFSLSKDEYVEYLEDKIIQLERNNNATSKVDFAFIQRHSSFGNTGNLHFTTDTISDTECPF